MKFLSEMMSKRKPSDEAAMPLDAPLEADGGGTGDFPLPDFAAVAGESLNPVAPVDTGDAMPSARSEARVEAPRERFVQDDESYDWDIGALDLSDDGDNPMETETGAERAQPLDAAMGGQARPEEEMMDKYEMDQIGDNRETEMDDAVDAKARAAQALASFAADLGATTAPEASDDDEDEPTAAASLHASAAEISGALGADEDADEDEDDEAEPALMAALSRLPDPKDAGTDMSWGDEDPGTPEAIEDDPWGEAPKAEAPSEDVMEMPEPEAPEMEVPEMDEPGMEAPEMEAPMAAMAKPDPWGEAPKTAGVSSLMAKTVQQKMSAMRAEAMARAAAPETDEMDDSMMAPEEAVPVMPSRSAFMGDGIAGQSDDDETEVASLSPLAALRAQREAALAAAKAAEPAARPAPAFDSAPEPEATAPALDAGGYDDEGYDDESYDDEGYDDEGYDDEGYDDEGYDDQAYDEEAYDDEAYDDGHDEEASDDATYEDDMSEGETMDADALDTWAPEEPVQRVARPAPVMEAPDEPASAMPEAAQPMPMRPPLRSAEPMAQPQAAAEDDLPEAAPAPRRAGRVKTRLLGFHKADESADPIRAAEEGRATAPTFPVGWLIVVKGPGRGACFTLSAGASKIGRGEDQAVRLDFGDTSISRDNHAVVAYDDESKQFFIGHGGKANLVRLNDMPVLSTETLNDGDVIRIGETVLLFVALCSDAFSWTDGPFAESTHAAE
ncbi:FHA domain-containing protein [Ovoidimarina sediminis]|uniref:FHA domain-containing protein n=1 Tax=Ovoidimarina sediminis TaxID=3079856 RepID=UPI00290CDA32|nr:FHA domain-containing protein [Rhodophyticola sp. MJ-SS7]MDU8943347.1 FHA domain-containing protein [Rhodophyticola sp. MJ-SS7]